MNAGKSVDEATASIHLEAKYPRLPGRARVKAAMRGIYNELKK